MKNIGSLIRKEEETASERQEVEREQAIEQEFCKCALEHRRNIKINNGKLNLIFFDIYLNNTQVNDPDEPRS
jgi:hypothetical protein